MEEEEEVEYLQWENQVVFHPKCHIQRSQPEVSRRHRHKGYPGKGFLIMGFWEGEAHGL